MTGFVLLLHVVGWGVLIFAVAPHDYRLGSTGVLGVGRRPDRLHARRPARLRRRPHRLDRQHHPQARRRGQVVGQRRLLVLPRPLLGRLRARLLLVAGVRSVAGVVQDENSTVGRRSALVGTIVAGSVPRAHRPDEPRRRRRHRQGVPPDADRRVRRGRARAAPAQPGLPGPHPRAGHPAGQQAVAPLPGGPAHGPGLRHRDPGRPARARRGHRPPSCCPGTRSSCCRSSSPPA